MIEVVKDHNLDLDKEKEDYQAQINIANLERNTLKDEKFKLDEKIDQLQEQIKRLEKNLQLASDEVNLRKTINDSMGENLMKHESESMQMAQKLALMKNQIMEYDKHVGLNRKFGAVKQGQIKAQACTIEFEEQKEGKNNNFYLVIDSKKQEVSINCENIESVEVN